MLKLDSARSDMEVQVQGPVEEGSEEPDEKYGQGESLGHLESRFFRGAFETFHTLGPCTFLTSPFILCSIYASIPLDFSMPALLHHG